MAIFRGPNVVTDGLVLNLDAGNVKSYPGSGNSWIDLSGFGNGGTLSNGASFITSNIGAISFDGVNDYVIIPHSNSLNLTTSVTIEVWFTTTTNKYSQLIMKNDIINTNIPYGIQLYNSDELGYVIYGQVSTSVGWKEIKDISNDRILKYNTLYCATLTYDGSILKLYKNSEMVSSASHSGTIITNNIGLYISYYQYLNGTIPMIRLYNKPLNDNEIQQNYQAIKSRFSI